MRELWRRMAAWLRWRSLDRDLDEELQFHLDMKTRETGDDVAARRALGGCLLVREQAQDAWGWRWLDDGLWDIRYAMRQFRQNPGFTAVAVTMLALGIAVNATVFTVTNAVLFKGFPLVERNDRLRYIGYKSNHCCVSYPDFLDWRAQSKSFSGMAIVHGVGLTVTDGERFRGEPQRQREQRRHLQARRAEADSRPRLHGDDEKPGAAPVAILNYGFWERRYGEGSVDHRPDDPVERRADDLHRRHAEGLLVPADDRRLGAAGADAERPQAGEPRHLDGHRPSGGRRHGRKRAARKWR